MTTRRVDKLKPHPANQSIYGDKPNKALIDSVKANGVLNPLLITWNNRIISGHRRYRAAEKVGLTKLPVVVFESRDEDLILAALIESNRQRKKTKLMIANEARELSEIERRSAAAREAATQFKPKVLEIGGGITSSEERLLVMEAQQLLEGEPWEVVEPSLRHALADPDLDLSETEVEREIECAKLRHEWDEDADEQPSEPALLPVAKPVHTHIEVAAKLDITPATARNAIAVGTALKQLNESEDPEDKATASLITDALEERGFKPAAALIPKPAINGRGRELTMIESTAGAKVATLNKTNDKVSWAWWTWNPVTGCLHDCPYCYARDIAERHYPQKFVPTFHADKLKAPSNTRVPVSQDPRSRRIFTCSMADLFGKWVPQEWIDAVFAETRACPQWEFLFLTKFPQRLAEIEWPDNAWVGTTVDRQYRVEIAEKAFRGVKAGVKWLSCEPMLEPLKFTSLEMFDLVVIGGASRSSKTDEFWPPLEWMIDLYNQARAAGCHVYFKPNANGDKTPVPQELPRSRVLQAQEALAV
ncbi:MAG: DUF5131 family protein [Blastocatellia bacterium]|nr:DUF5131 family protein [Blastocatellia bacterium]